MVPPGVALMEIITIMATRMTTSAEMQVLIMLKIFSLFIEHSPDAFQAVAFETQYVKAQFGAAGCRIDDRDARLVQEQYVFLRR